MKRVNIKKRKFLVLCILIIFFILLLAAKNSSIIMGKENLTEYSLAVNKNFVPRHKGERRLTFTIQNPKKKKLELKYKGILPFDSDSVELINDTYGMENVGFGEGTDSSATIYLNKEDAELFEWEIELSLEQPSYIFEVWVDGAKVAEVSERDQEVREIVEFTNTSDSRLNYTDLVPIQLKQLNQSNKMMRTFSAVNPVDVMNGTEFLNALNNVTVDQINIKNDFAVVNMKSVILNRNVIINGEGHSLTNIGRTSNTSNRYTITLGDVTTPTELVIKDLAFTGTYRATDGFVNSGNSNWTITYHNVTNTSGNTSQIYNNGGANIIVAGETLLNNSRASTSSINTTGEVLFEEAQILSSSNVRDTVVTATNVIFKDTVIQSGVAIGNMVGQADNALFQKVTFGSNTTISGTVATATKVTFEETVVQSNATIGSMVDQANEVLFKKSRFESNATINGTIATATENVTFDETVFQANATVSGIIAQAKNVLITNKSEIKDVTFKNKFYTTDSVDSILQIDQGSVININLGSTVQPISVINGGSVINVFDEGTYVKFTSSATATANAGGIFNFDTGSHGPAVYLNVQNYATLELLGTASSSTPAVMMQADDSEFNVSDNSTIYLETNGASNNYAGIIRYRYSGNSSFNINESSNITLMRRLSTASNGDAPSIRMNGGGNGIKVDNNSIFNLTNYGNGTPQNGGTTTGASSSATNQGIQYVNDSSNRKADYFKATNGSLVRIEAKVGPAIDAGYDTEVTIESGSYFEAIGKTASATGSNASGGPIFRSANGSLYFNMDNPAYYNLRNNSTATKGGTVLGASRDKAYYANGKNSEFISKNSDVSLWERTSNLDGIPTYDRTLINYKLETTKYTVSESPDADFTSKFSTNGLSDYARISANNTTPIVDKIKDATNADKAFYVFAKMHDGFDENNEKIIRAARDGEVYVKIGITYPDGTTETRVEQTTLGDGTLYDEVDQYGYAKFDFDDFLIEGTTVKVLKAWRGDKEDETLQHITPIDEIEAVPTKTVIDVCPPEPVEIETALTNATKQLEGTATENGAKVFIKVNGSWLKDAQGNILTTRVDEEKWSIDLPYYLQEEDKVDVYLKDNTVIDASVEVSLPDSYTQDPDNIYGNLNIDYDAYQSYQGYHDAVKENQVDYRFGQAVRRTVKDVIPTPKLTKEVSSSAGSTTSVGDTLTYTLVVTNDKKDSSDWKEVSIVDELPKGVSFNAKKNQVTMDDVVLVEGTDYTYNADTRLLKINIGSVKAQESKKIIFDVKVESEAYGQQIKNIATAIGYSPQEVNYEMGVINPQAEYIELSVQSNEVDAPGKIITGTLTFVSAPEVIDFGLNQTKIYGKFTADHPTYDFPLIVNDTRPVQSGWSLNVVLEEAMTYQTDSAYVLPNALRYKKGNTETILVEHQSVKILSTPEHSPAGEYNISESEWDENGFVMKLDSKEYRKLGSYKAKLKFTLSETP